MSVKRILLVVLAVSAVLLSVRVGPGRGAAAQALPPPLGADGEVGTIPYTGMLADLAGRPVADGAYALRFTLYPAENGGEPLWSEEQPAVQVWDGDLLLRLGSVTPIPETVLDAVDLWLAVAVRGPAEVAYTHLAPRQRVSATGPVTLANPISGAACPHDHYGEEWQSSGTHYGLMVENVQANSQGLVGLAWNGASAIGVRGWSYDGTGVKGISISQSGVLGLSENGDGVYGEASAPGKGGVSGQNTGAGYGVFGSSASGVAVMGRSDTGAGVRGEASSASQAGVYGWNGSSGPGVVGYSSGGPAVSAVGTGEIYSSADSVLYLSPHDMVAREENQALVSITPLDNGGVRVRNLSGSGLRRMSIPVSSFGTLFGSTLYVKSLEVCYKAPAAFTFISVTGVYKNQGSDAGWEAYLEDNTSHSESAYDCYPVTASTPRTPIDNSTWAQFNMTFAGSGLDIYVYTVKLTLTENQN